MTRNPLLNALAAIAYIAIVANLMFYGTEHTHPSNTVLIPITVLSLFTLSASAMAFIFFYQPFRLYFDGKKKEGIDLIFKTIACFAVFTAIAFVILISGIIR